MTNETEPTARERGQKTCRAALMTVIGLHRGMLPLDAALGQTIVAATQALMDLDGLRGPDLAAGDRDADAIADAAETVGRLQCERDAARSQVESHEAVLRALTLDRGRLLEYLGAIEHQLSMRNIDDARALLAKMRGVLA